MQYIIIPASESQTANDRTLAFSRELFRLSRPNPEPDDVTEFLFGFISHPETGESAMEVDLELEVYISPNASAAALAELLNPTEEQISEVSALAALVESQKGSRVVFDELIPSWITARTREEMEAEGWFPPLPELE